MKEIAPATKPLHHQGAKKKPDLPRVEGTQPRRGRYRRFPQASSVDFVGRRWGVFKGKHSRVVILKHLTFKIIHYTTNIETSNV